MTAALIILPWVLLALVLALGWWLQRRHERALHASAATERALKATEGTLERISQAVESASDAIGIGDMEGTSLYHNQAHIALFGYTVDELNAVPEPAALFHDKVVATAIHATIRGGYSWAGETDVRTKDGRVVPCFVRADIIRGRDGQPTGIFGVFTDITERRRTERLLDEQRQRLEITLQSIGDAVLTTDREGCIVLLNPVAEQLIGKTQAEAAGRRLSELLPLRDEANKELRESSALALLRAGNRRRVSASFLFIDPTGQERLLAEIATLIRTTDGRAVGAVVALRDVTRERRDADDSARATKLESLGMMAGSIAHDFGNLLTAVSANVQLAQLEPGLTEVAKNRLEQADRAVWRARDVTRQLTIYAKGGTTVKKRVALEPLLREAAGFATQNTKVQLWLKISPSLWPVEADESQLVQVINNLAVNGVQAMPDGGLLTVTAENFSPTDDSRPPLRDSRQVKIAVTDTGTGIPPEHLAKIFEPFFTTKSKGTGLGLATCYSIVKKHGGDLRVETAINFGTTFHILLPAAPGVVDRESTPPFVARPARPTLGRILLLDGDRATREALVLMLGLIDFDAVETTTEAELLEKFAAARGGPRAFTGVLIDLRAAEGQNGVGTIRALRELEPGARVVAIGGFEEKAGQGIARPLGFDLALAKPVKMEVLREALQICRAPAA